MKHFKKIKHLIKLKNYACEDYIVLHAIKSIVL